MKLKFNNDVLVILLFLVGITVYFAYCLTMGKPMEGRDPSENLWPLILVAMAYPTCLIILVRALKSNDVEKRSVFSWKNNIYIIIIVGLTGLYVAAFKPLGYWISTFVYCFGLILALEYEKKGKSKVKILIFSMIGAFILAFAGFLLFQIVFDVRLPQGLLSGLFNALAHLGLR